MMGGKILVDFLLEHDDMVYIQRHALHECTFLCRKKECFHVIRACQLKTESDKLFVYLFFRRA